MRESFKRETKKRAAAEATALMNNQFGNFRLEANGEHGAYDELFGYVSVCGNRLAGKTP